MSLKSVYEKFCYLEQVSSTLIKKEYLNKYLQDKLFLKVVKYCLDPRKKYHTKKLPAFTENSTFASVDRIFKCLDALAEQTGASNKDKQALALVSSIDTETWEVVYRICNGDLRCGCGVRLINTVRPDTVPFTPYLRCSSKRQIHKATFPAFWQVKANGKYSEMVCTDKVAFGSRDSHKIKNVKHLKKLYTQVSGQFGQNVYMGELRVWNIDGSIMDRQKGNGIINTKNLDKKIAKRIFFSLWDCVPYADYKNEKCNIPYDTRLDNAREMVGAIDGLEIDQTSFAIIETHIVKDLEEAQKLTNTEIAKGGEGGVLKKTKAKWKHGTSLEQFKMKRLYEGELRVIAWEYGTKVKKHADRMGRILLGTDDEKLKTYCGMGFSDKLREENWDKHIGRIVEVEYEEVTKARGATIYALSGPAAFIDFRDGKDNTDTLEDLMKR